MPLNTADRVIVRIWTSKDNQQFPGQNVGHISIETPDSYMSLWPAPSTQEERDAYRQEYRQAGALQQKHLRYFRERSSDFHQTYQNDYEAEDNHPPQVTICFYSLRHDLMNTKFNELKNNIAHWRLIGSNLLVQNVESTIETFLNHSKSIESEVGKKDVDNCASLALKILRAGYIGNLIDNYTEAGFSSTTSSVVTPDDILKILIPAKLIELENHRETATEAFQFDEETERRLLEENRSSASSLCAMM